MSQTWLFLLPVIAVLVAFNGTWRESRRKHKHRSRKFKRRRNAIVLTHQALIASLLLAPIIAFFSPIEFPPALAQGVILTALFMLPVVLFVLMPALKAPVDTSKQRNNSVQNHKPDERAKQREVKNQAPDSSLARAHRSQSVDLWLDTQVSDATYTEDSEVVRHSNKLYASVDQISSNDSLKTADAGLDETLSLDQTLSLEQQMENIDDAVLHLDLGLDGYTDIYSDAVDDGLTDHDRATNAAISMARDSIRSGSQLTRSNGDNLPARSYGELTELVAGLHKDKIRLQKLVIAQKAVLDAEKQSHQKTRVLAKDAMSVMRKAREGQRIAEKLARRERSQRKRLEADYIKMRKQLENALSTRPKSVIDL